MLELNTNLLVDLGGWPALKEARTLLERGKVLEMTRDGAVIRARVQGAEKIYDAQITLADRVANVEVHCTCIESRKNGRVCAHSLAAGLAAMQPAMVNRKAASSVAAVYDRRTENDKPRPEIGGHRPPPQAEEKRRWLIEEAPAGTPRIEITVLLPLQLRESLAGDPVRIILEARRESAEQTQPWDVVARDLGKGFAVGEEDERLLAALEQIAGGVQGINSVARGKIGALFRTLNGHPRVWLGKKERVEIHASAEKPQIILSRREDGALLLEVRHPELVEGSVQSVFSPAGGTDPSTSRHASVRSAQDDRLLKELPITGWGFDGTHLVETPVLPAGFVSGQRVISVTEIPDFLSREFPALERNHELIFAPGFEEFRLETGTPHFEARLEGALSGLTLELVAHYDDQFFSIGGLSVAAVNDRRTEGNRLRAEVGGHRPPLQSEYWPDPRQPNRFWRRNEIAEKRALAQVEAAGFKPVRSGASTFSITHENQVAPFLVNTLPRWRQNWITTFGPRLEATMREVDVAQPEFSLRSGSGENWLNLDLKLTVRGRPISLPPAEIHRWLQTGQTHARTADKRVLMLPTEAWDEMREVLTDCTVDQVPGGIRVARTSAPFLAGALTAQGFRATENVAAEISAPLSVAEINSRLDPKLWEQLRPYQQQGVAWLAGLSQKNFHGLLADDMGLGKTLQALAFAAWLKASQTIRHPERSGAESKDQFRPPGERQTELIPRQARDDRSLITPCLIVCPTSLVTNWLREAARFTPHLRTLDLTGSNRAEKFATRNEYDLLVTSYAILRRDVEQYRNDEFSLVILDEAQHIKNRSSQNAQSAKALKARHRLILTGTPLENSVLDLWSLYDFLLPGYLGTAADFKERYETPLTREVSPRVMERLRHRVRPFFLRRTKEEVLTELPPKLEHLALCDLTDEQRAVYRAVLEQGRRDVFEHSGKAGKGRDRIAVLTTLLRLRQVCCHLDLLPRGDEKREWKEPSAKLDRTFELIDEAVDGGHRVLVFSQFVKALHLLRDEARRRELKFCYLDGQTVDRQAEVDKFQNDADIPLFFISLKAGGVGLNLTGADTVIHFDPWWNPAVEEQATSRAHRMGQSRSVQAYKLIAAGTVEEKIQALQARKKELFEASLAGDEAFVEKLTGEDLEELLAE